MSWSKLLLPVLLAGSALAADCVPRCKNPIVRKEWRTLSSDEKESYIDAVQCILKKPAQTPHFDGSGVKSRYDDLVYTHILQTFDMHYTGHFLAWHRYFTATYERMLRAECGYEGAQPYWDWTLDAGDDYLKSPVFDGETGFGGNGPWVEGDPANPFWVPGRSGGGCVQDGPFAGDDDLVHLGPQDGTSYNPQCLRRDLAPAFVARYLGWNQTKLTLEQGDFGWFARVMEGGPSFDASGIHGGGHYGVGGTYGQMGDLYASPSDPLFFLHHANIDRVWWSWQTYDLETRLKDVSGPIAMMDYENLQQGNVTLDYPMHVGVSAPRTTIAEVMDIRGAGVRGIMCYEYDELYQLD